jgi:hypothetical protein
MSLKAFHILFVIASTTLTLGFGFWCVRHFARGDGSSVELGLGVASLLLSAGLVCYGKYFLRKLKHISYL